MDLGRATIYMIGIGDLTRFAFDTNILVYAEEVERSPADRDKFNLASRLLTRLLDVGVTLVFPLQCLAELHRVLIRKRRMASPQAATAVSGWREVGEVIGTSTEIFDAAVELATDHQFQIYDAIIMAAAVRARCDLLLSEDMQDGFVWRGVTIANPFAATLDPRLARLLA